MSIFNQIFGKRERVFAVKGNRQQFLQAKETLKRAGIPIMESGTYEEEMPVCGCGAKVDFRNYGPNGRIDRYTYYICVAPSDAEPARKALETLTGDS